MSYQIKLLELPDQSTLSIREIHAVQELPQFFSKAYGMIMQYLGKLGQTPTGMPFAAYYNLDMQHLDVEAGFPVGGAFEGQAEVKPGKIPGGKFASTIHVGPYDGVEPAYNALNVWIKQHGYEPTGVAYEYYLNDPSEKPGVIPETEIRLPIK